jgi:hypothetical protein
MRGVLKNLKYASEGSAFINGIDDGDLLYSTMSSATFENKELIWAFET